MKDLDLFRKSPVFSRNKKLLEIGYGKAGYLIRRQCEKTGIAWYGIDIKFEHLQSKNPQRNTAYGTADKIPFPNGEFGAILSTHSIEHWCEHLNNDPSYYPVAMKEINRALCKDGVCFTIVPIGYVNHGNNFFVRGNMDDIRSIFDNSIWQNVEFEECLKDYAPLEPFLDFPKPRTDKPIWNLNIIASK